ncbi:hypothetical protein [Methylotenera sp.]|uniref:hypothetical protein n=1 Tax=Methylotenera sp. TaxID=2051956 RepID=UPI002488BDC0|nr:hypothetical protein [Methylotenera sp.]MDI1300209.1 hypothetical protein [Methylotenera sp.]
MGTYFGAMRFAYCQPTRHCAVWELTLVQCASLIVTLQGNAPYEWLVGRFCPRMQSFKFTQGG